MKYIIETPLKINQIVWRLVKYDNGTYKTEKCKIDAIVYDSSKSVSYLLNLNCYNVYYLTDLFTDYKTAREACKNKNKRR